MAVATHPLGGQKAQAVQHKADALLDLVVAGLTGT